MNAECDLKKPLMNFKVTKDKLHGEIFNIKLEFQFQIQFWKKLQNGGYRDLVNLNMIDACWGIDNLDKFPLLSAQIDWFNQTFPGALDKCPKTVCAIVTLNIATFYVDFSFFLKLQYMRFHNITLSMPFVEYSPRWHIFPNGIYKLKLTDTSETDPEIFSVTFYVEFRFHNRGYEF